VLGCGTGKFNHDDGDNGPLVKRSIHQEGEQGLQPRGMDPQLTKDAAIVGSMPIGRRTKSSNYHEAGSQRYQEASHHRLSGDTGPRPKSR
jgi:hypothetical protein